MVITPRSSSYSAFCRWWDCRVGISGLLIYTITALLDVQRPLGVLAWTGAGGGPCMVGGYIGGHLLGEGAVKAIQADNDKAQGHNTIVVSTPGCAEGLLGLIAFQGGHLVYKKGRGDFYFMVADELDQHIHQAPPEG